MDILKAEIARKRKLLEDKKLVVSDCIKNKLELFTFSNFAFAFIASEGRKQKIF